VSRCRWSFISVLAATSVIVFGITHWLVDHLYAARIDARDATIKSVEAQRDSYKSQLDVASKDIQEAAHLRSELAQAQADDAALRKEINNRPTPLKNRCLSMAKLLKEAANAWDKELKEQPSATFVVNRNFWAGTVNEYGQKLIKLRLDLLDYGLRSTTFQSLTSDQAMMAYSQTGTPDDLRKIAEEIERFAGQLKE